MPKNYRINVVTRIYTCRFMILKCMGHIFLEMVRIFSSPLLSSKKLLSPFIVIFHYHNSLMFSVEALAFLLHDNSTVAQCSSTNIRFHTRSLSYSHGIHSVPFRQELIHRTKILQGNMCWERYVQLSHLWCITYIWMIWDVTAHPVVHRSWRRVCGCIRKQSSWK